MEVTKFHVDKMPVEHARNLFKLSEALLQDNQDDSNDEAERLRDSAEIFLKRRKPDMVASDTESAYDDLIPIFWRWTDERTWNLLSAVVMLGSSDATAV